MADQRQRFRSVLAGMIALTFGKVAYASSCSDFVVETLAANSITGN